MAKCSRCKNEPATQNSGMCKDCHEKSKASIQQAKDDMENIHTEMLSGKIANNEAITAASQTIENLKQNNIPIPMSIKKQFAKIAPIQAKLIKMNNAYKVLRLVFIALVSLAVFLLLVYIDFFQFLRLCPVPKR